MLKMKKFIYSTLTLLIITSFSHFAQLKNKPELNEQFMDMGFGIFIHWSMDSQLGSVISHSMVGASEKYLDKYIIFEIS